MKSRKVYIFLTGPIVRIGGSQLYVLRKMRWLQDNGWTVLVFSVENGEIKIPEFYEFKKYIYPFLAIPIQFFNDRKRLRLIDALVRMVGDADKIVVQSHNLNAATWGEALAARLHAVHIVHLLVENIVCRHKITRKLLDFKCTQGSLYAIKEQVLKSFFKDGKDYKANVLSAVGCASGNVIDEDFHECIIDRGGDYRILAIGRLEKLYMPHIFKAVVDFAQRHSGEKINFYVLGSAVNKSTETRLREILSDCNNVRIAFLGEMLPVPNGLFKMVDVCIASAGCASMVYRDNNALCITVDVNDFGAIGIMGVTTMNSLFRDREPQIAIADVLEDVLVNRKYSLSQVIPCKEIKLDYSSHQNVILKSFFNNSYFDFNSNSLSFYEKIMQVIVALIGYHRYIGCVRIFKRFCSLVRRVLERMP